ncbi:MAG TPA: hypothetical protein VMM18_14860 [Gemmatimonadaceae bacterium]|nr:hypothetical protein [Gemmatimonadaceae bacterium]
MKNVLAALLAACMIVGGPAAPYAGAQEWNDTRTRALVERATERRAQQLADTGLVDYRATARGYLTFLAQLGEGFPDPPKVVKADELALEVYWRSPDLSKQRIVGRRDTLLLPTDIEYHRDHLGIVQNNFPSIIRLGDGDEVRDVPHPLSAAGLREYDFAISDSLSIRLPGRLIEVIQVRVRPRDDRQPRVIGAVYLDRATADVVRMAFNFTRAAYLDRYLEDLAIVLENGLVGARFWLPSRQEIEIRRTGTWLEYPARGIIRGRWEICCYELNQGLEAGIFAGPEIVDAPASVRARFEWSGSIMDSLPPDVRAARPEDVEQIQAEARRLVRAEALARSRQSALATRRVSDIVRVNRVEGLALGTGVSHRLGRGFGAELSARYGVADEALKGIVGLRYEHAAGLAVRLFAHRTHRQAEDLPEVSLLRNSFAAQEFGSDWTNPYDARGVGVELRAGVPGASRWRLEIGVEEQDPLEVNATPTSGSFGPTIAAWPIRSTRAVLGVERPPRLGPFGTEVRGSAELRGSLFRGSGMTLDRERAALGRVFAHIEIERPLGVRRLVFRSTVAAVEATDGLVPPQDMVYLGGPITGPGYGFHTIHGTFGASQRIELRTPVPFVPIPLGRFGRVPASATLAPYAHASWAAGAADSPTGPRPALGVGLLTLFDVLRFDVARGLCDGRWTFSVDVGREFWGIL